MSVARGEQVTPGLWGSFLIPLKEMKEPMGFREFYNPCMQRISTWVHSYMKER